MTIESIISTTYPHDLPFVSLQDRRELPDVPGVYFCLKGDRILYIGKAATSIRQRWAGHHRFDQLSAIGGVRVAYKILHGLTDDDMALVENGLIYYLKPEINSEVHVHKHVEKINRARGELSAVTRVSILEDSIKQMKTVQAVRDRNRTFFLLVQQLSLEVPLVIDSLLKVATQVHRDIDNPHQPYWGNRAEMQDLKSFKPIVRKLIEVLTSVYNNLP